MMRLALLYSLLSVAAAAKACEAWCEAPCGDLNGNVQVECGACKADGSNQCYPGAPDYDNRQLHRENRQERDQQLQQGEGQLQRVGVDGNGMQEEAPAQLANPDAPIESTSSSVVYATPYYEIANKHRVLGRVPGKSALDDHFDVVPLPLPQETPHRGTCEVHSCALAAGDHACANNETGCDGPKGHLRPLGEQYEEIILADEVDVRADGGDEFNASAFYKRFLSPNRPLVIKGGAYAATDPAWWSDEALLERCKLDNGYGWQVLVEQNNRITQNDRHPLMPPDWDFCRFLQEYRKPEYKNMLYLVTSIAEEGLDLARRVNLPEVLKCNELEHGLHDARLWMSLGNTSSSLHFDTHDNLMLQLDGRKEVLLWHPNETANFYMDHHDKYGLSPVNVDHVDLERFPQIANATTYLARTEPGDMIFIPDGWWHAIHSKAGRNVALALEMFVFGSDFRVWPKWMRRRNHAKGTYWAEQVRLKQAVRERFVDQFPSRFSRGREPVKCDAPMAAPPRTLADVKQLGHEIEW